MIAVTGATGGVGTTSLAVNLGCSLAADPANSVVLLDLDLCLGDADVFLDTIPEYTLSDVAQNIARLDLTLLKRSLTKHDTGLYLLPRPVQLEDARHITTDELTRVLGLLKASFTHVIIDTSKGYNALDMHVLNEADDVLLVTQLDLPCLRNVVRLMMSFKETADVRRQSEDRRQPRRLRHRPDQPEEGPGNDRPRNLLAGAERLSRDGRSAQQRRAAGAASAQGRDHAVDQPAGRRSERQDRRSQAETWRQSPQLARASGRPAAERSRSCNAILWRGTAAAGR